MSGLSSPHHRRHIVTLAALSAIVGAGLLAWFLFWPPPHLLCRLERSDTRAVPSPLASLTLAPLPVAGGLVVTSLRSHGPAEQRGVRVGDVVETVDGRHVHTLNGMTRILRTDTRPIVSVRMRGAMGRYDVLLTRTAQACRDP